MSPVFQAIYQKDSNQHIFMWREIEAETGEDAREKANAWEFTVNYTLISCKPLGESNA